jgi:dienelactone hydrolase
MNGRRSLFALALLVVAVLLWRPAAAHVRAVSLLVRFVDHDAHGIVADVGRHPVIERDVAVPVAGGTSRGRLYWPGDEPQAPGIVLVHGVHFKGIDEPRLRAFALTIAASGVAVLTPEVRELCDYRIDVASVEAIASAAHVLATELGGTRPTRVGVMGLSFAGGLAIIAAAAEETAADIAFVVSVGGHDDLSRVLRFFATDRIQRPDGSVEHLHAHEYGPVVLLYSHVADFFPAEDTAAAHDALRLWLHEDFTGAREAARALSPGARAKMDLVFDHRVSELAPELLAEIGRLEPELAAVSPSAVLARVRVPVFVLHGAGDNVIPPTEALWLTHDLPHRWLRASLVSAAIQHVELQGEPTLGDELALVHFMSGVLEAADESR